MKGPLTLRGPPEKERIGEEGRGWFFIVFLLSPFLPFQADTCSLAKSGNDEAMRKEVASIGDSVSAKKKQPVTTNTLRLLIT